MNHAPRTGLKALHAVDGAGLVDAGRVDGPVLRLGDAGRRLFFRSWPPRESGSRRSGCPRPTYPAAGRSTASTSLPAGALCSARPRFLFAPRHSRSYGSVEDFEVEAR